MDARRAAKFWRVGWFFGVFGGGGGGKYEGVFFIVMSIVCIIVRGTQCHVNLLFGRPTGSDWNDR